MTLTAGLKCGYICLLSITRLISFMKALSAAEEADRVYSPIGAR
jgi:hypothetical protein